MREVKPCENADFSAFCTAFNQTCAECEMQNWKYMRLKA